MKKFWLFLRANPLSGVLGRERVLRFWNLSSFWTVLLFRAICEPTFPIALLMAPHQNQSYYQDNNREYRDRERQERERQRYQRQESEPSTGTVTAKTAIINAITHNLG